MKACLHSKKSMEGVVGDSNILTPSDLCHPRECGGRMVSVLPHQPPPGSRASQETDHTALEPPTHLREVSKMDLQLGREDLCYPNC